MSLLEIGKTGASRQSWRSPSARALLKSLMDDAKDPHAGQVMFAAFLHALLPTAVRDAFENEEEERRLISVIEYWFTNNYNSLLNLYPRPEDKKRNDFRQKSKSVAENKIREAVRKRIVEKAEMLLLEWAMPNGKKLRDCTGEEVRELGAKMPAWFKAIAAKVKPTEIVGKVLSEDQVRAMAPKGWK